MSKHATGMHINGDLNIDNEKHKSCMIDKSPDT